MYFLLLYLATLAICTLAIQREIYPGISFLNAYTYAMTSIAILLVILLFYIGYKISEYKSRQYIIHIDLATEMKEST